MKTPLFILLPVLLLSFPSSADQPTARRSQLDYRSYPSGQLLWLWTPQNILLYRFDTKALKTMVLSESAEGDSVLDIAENSDALWTATKSDFYQIDMSTSTIERIPGGPSDYSSCKVASDIDYAWVAKNDTLWKFDKLSREWFAYGLGSNSTEPGSILGTYSDGDKVCLLTRSRVLHFSIADEKWSAYPMGAVSFSSAAHFYPVTKTLIVVEGNKVYRYIMEKLSWDVVTAPSDIIDIHYTDDMLFFLTKDGVFQYTAASSSLRRLDIPDTRGIRCLSLLSDTTLTLASERSLIQYVITSRTIENIPYPPQMKGTYPDKIFQGDILLYSQTLTLFNWSTRTWELFRVPDVSGRKNILTWDDRSLRLKYAPEIESQLHGNITQRVKLIDGGYLYDSVTLDSERVFYYTPGKLGDDLYSDLTLHTSLSGDRYADLTFKKETGRLPEKGAFYRGEDDDYLESARLGTNNMTTPLSQTLPEVQYEGANAIVHSKQELETRDRKVMRAQGGAGLRTSRTMHSVLNYNKGGKYTLADPDSLERYLIIPGSVRINVDGEEIDTLLFSVAPSTGELSFNRRDLLDPSSVIIATYKVQTVPDSGLDVVELLPENNFGIMSHGAATVSPADWVSVQAGYASVNPRYTVTDSIGVDTLGNTVFEARDSSGQARTVTNLMVPLEFRNKRQNLLLKVTPELSFETGKKAEAGALGLQSRLGDWYLGKATSLFFNTSLFDTAYEATDLISRGYGRKKSEIDAKLQHDILTELPLTFSYANRAARFGNEEYMEASAGAHFQDAPKLDLILSRNVIDADNSEELAGDTTADTLILDRKKDKIKLRLYEPSSPLAQSLLHFNKVSYDLSYTRFASHKESDLDPFDSLINDGPRMPGSGDIMYGSLSLSPISSITVSGLTTYKKNSQDTVDFTDTITMHSVENSPYLLFQTIDAPPGFDISGTYAADYISTARTDTNATITYDSSRVAIQRQFLVIVKPGTWTRYLTWLSPRFGMSHDLTCTYDTVKQSGIDIFLGSKRKAESNLTYNFGSHFYPTGEILFRQENAVTTSDSIRNYYTFNDLKWWFGANRLWQTRLEFNDIVTTSLADGDNDGTPETELLFRKNFLKTFMFYDVNWYSWLRTYEKASIDFTKQDSSFFELDTVSGLPVIRDTIAGKLSFGPEFMVSFNIQQKGPIKMFLNGHTAKLAWTKENGLMKQGASFSYTTFVELILKPNIAFQSNNALAWSYGLFTYNGDLSMRLLF